jgi:hypothetical protein
MYRGFRFGRGYEEAGVAEFIVHLGPRLAVRASRVQIQGLALVLPKTLRLVL